MDDGAADIRGSRLRASRSVAPAVNEHRRATHLFIANGFAIFQTFFSRSAKPGPPQRVLWSYKIKSEHSLVKGCGENRNYPVSHELINCRINRPADPHTKSIQ